jgi:ABC-type cobalamin/Fe3+-siderophores transport system ATPase subunit
MDTGEAAFELDRISLSRAGKPVLRDLSARIPGGATCIAGPSGSGKSTLLRLLDRLSDPESGTVRYRGRDVREHDPLELRREVMLVPQLPALLDGTVEDNLRFAGGLGGREPPVERLLGLAGLDRSFAERDAGRLSVGEQQRAMLARALALEPRVLLLDEPTAHLDLKHQLAVLELARELARERGLAVLATLHDLNQAALYADRVALLSEGRLLATGRPSEVFAADRLGAAFGVRVAVSTHPVHGTPLVAPIANGK